MISSPHFDWALGRAWNHFDIRLRANSWRLMIFRSRSYRRNCFLHTLDQFFRSLKRNRKRAEGTNEKTNLFFCSFHWEKWLDEDFSELHFTIVLGQILFIFSWRVDSKRRKGTRWPLVRSFVRSFDGRFRGRWIKHVATRRLPWEVKNIGKLEEIDNRNRKEQRTQVSNDVWKMIERRERKERVQRARQNIEIINMLLSSPVSYTCIVRERERKREREKQTASTVLWQMTTFVPKNTRASTFVFLLD